MKMLIEADSGFVRLKEKFGEFLCLLFPPSDSKCAERFHKKGFSIRPINSVRSRNHYLNSACVNLTVLLLLNALQVSLFHSL